MFVQADLIVEVILVKLNQLLMIILIQETLLTGGSY